MGDRVMGMWCMVMDIHGYGYGYVVGKGSG